MTDTEGRHPELATDKFESWTWCPSCGLHALHGLRELRTIYIPDEDAQRQHAEEIDLMVQEASAQDIDEWRTAFERFFPGTPEAATPSPVKATADPAEAMYACFRICQCGHEWGQK